MRCHRYIWDNPCDSCALLGDAFLKYLSSIYVFVTHPSCSEGALHQARQQIISNKSLFRNATRAGIPAYIQAKPFASKHWHPPNFKLGSLSQGPDKTLHQESAGDTQEVLGAIFRGEPSPAMGQQHETLAAEQSSPVQKQKRRSNKENLDDMQWLGEKVICIAELPTASDLTYYMQAIADVAEAIIGAAYITGGRETALKVTKALQIPVLNVEQWSDFGRKVLAPPPKITEKLNPKSVEAIESLIGHKIAHPHLLAQALVGPDRLLGARISNMSCLDSLLYVRVRIDHI